MISMLEGTIARRGEGFLVVLCHGIGYQVFVPDPSVFAPQSAVTLHTHQVVREDANELFGFRELEQLELFECLIGISGIGPRGAQKIVAVGTASHVKGSIMKGDLAFLTSISGIGKKTAQKIILELKGVLAEEETSDVVDDEALQALLGLGYTLAQARTALPPKAEGTTEARVRAALKHLAH